MTEQNTRTKEHLQNFINASKKGNVDVAEQAFTDLVTAQTGKSLTQQISGAFFDVVNGFSGNAKHVSCHTQDSLLVTIGQENRTACTAARQAIEKLTA